MQQAITNMFKSVLKRVFILLFLKIAFCVLPLQRFASRLGSDPYLASCNTGKGSKEAFGKTHVLGYV